MASDTHRQRRRKTLDPCPRCSLHRLRCICTQIPRLDLATRLSLVVHYKELKRTTNTGSLAHEALVNSRLRIRGQKNEPSDLSDLLLAQYENYVLFPSDDAMDLETLRPSKPVNLIVSDGNWRQAGKLNVRHPELSHLTRVKVRRASLSTQHLRREHLPDGMATLEAIAIAFSILEGPDVGNKLMMLYQAKLEATLLGRGLSFHSPANAFQNDFNK